MSQYSKAIAALVMGVLAVANTLFGANWNIPVETVNAIVAMITPVLVWAIPNKASV